MLTLFGQGLCESPQARQAVGSQLVQDAGQHLCQLLGLSVASDGEGVGCEGGLHFRIVEVDHGPLICKHVNLQETKFFTVKKIKYIMMVVTQNDMKNFRITSSIPEILLTPSFFSENWSFLSSAVAVLCTTFFFLRALPYRNKHFWVLTDLMHILAMKTDEIIGKTKHFLPSLTEQSCSSLCFANIIQ